MHANAPTRNLKNSHYLNTEHLFSLYVYKIKLLFKYYSRLHFLMKIQKYGTSRCVYISTLLQLIHEIK